MSCQGLNLQQLQERVRETLKKEYLLVLDDVWTESHDEWLNLAKYLIESGVGQSWIVVTTRSKATAIAVDSNITYELEGLPKKDSWHLFSSMAREEQANRIDFLDISRDTVKGCGNVPLALRIAGSLLRGQDKTKWESFRQFRLTNITQGMNKVMSMLMFSYHHLPPTLKESFITRTKTCTHLQDKNYCQGLDTEVPFPVSTFVAKWKNLRALDLSRLVEIGELLHLRYLDLSMNENLGMLPESISSLVNLQTLNLRQCEGLKELPNGMTKLVKLRFLDIRYVCLSYMPPDMGNLTCLRWLPWLVVKNSSKKQRISELEDLKSLNLKGHLTIEITNDYEYVKENHKAGGYLSTKGLLNDIEIYCGEEMIVRHQEDLLEHLLPHSNLKRLLFSGYNGVRIPSWARKDSLTAFLPNLVTIELYSCNGLRELPWLGELSYLETLIQNGLDDLECIEDTRDHNSRSRYEEATSSSVTMGGSNSSRARETESLFFPSLKVLQLCYLPKLTRWRRQSVSRHGSRPRVRPCLSLSFPCLSELTIEDCPELGSIPPCPLVEELIMIRFNERLQLITKERQGEVGRSARESGNARTLEVEAQIVDNVSYFKAKAMGTVQCLIEKLRFIPLYSLVERLITINRRLRIITKEQRGEMGRSAGQSGSSMHPQIKILTTDNVSCFKSFPMEAFQNLTDLTISDDILLESLSEVQELFYSCSSSLQSLSIISCENLISLRGVFQIGMPWKLLQKSLRYLEQVHKHISELPDGMRFSTALQSLRLDLPCLEASPEWIGSLSSLEILELPSAEKLKSLPDTMQNLTSLRQLGITCCSQDLEERYQEPHGEDWLKIQRIPQIRITTDWY
ncbi:hypothetical protein Cgig2_003796 [Carnegiea gigantea]|uniref:NB-ARC domain-containing protein n=1 Tax=Carnegiea gigantea TaxID=171969 RepID=A0A9Q1Q444_9CARY|nr:hypothetical protein Cgig2_003796 [Carnegiea gigantea]